MDSNIAMWSLIVGTLLPPVVALVQQPKWAQWVRVVVMLVISLIAGAGTAYFAGQLDTTDWVTSSLIIVVSAISAYKGIWKPTEIAPKIEAATSPSAGE